MSVIIIERTPDTPGVILDSDQGILELIGNSYPENSIEFFQKIYDWIHSYFSDNKFSLSAVFKLNYFNTSSAKCILNLMNILQHYHGEDKIITVAWYYDPDDEDMLETGKAFSVDFSMPFDIRAC